MVMNSYVVSGPGVQLSAVFRVPCTAGGANFDVSSHLMAWAQAEKVNAQFLSPVLLGIGSAVQARLAGQRRGSATCSPLPPVGSLSSPGSRLGLRWHLPEVRAVPSAGSSGVCPWSRASVSSPEKWDTTFAWQ